MKAICPECEIEIRFNSKKGSVFNCSECGTKLEVVDLDAEEAILDYSEDDN